MRLRQKIQTVPRAPVLSHAPDGIVLRVSAGILLDAELRILIAERKGDRAFVNQWEFPGGKIAAGENAQDALHRELAEELGIGVVRANHFCHVEHEYPDRKVSIDFYLVDSWTGEPTGLLGQALEWCQPAELDESRLLPADAPVLRALREHVSGRAAAL